MIRIQSLRSYASKYLLDSIVKKFDFFIVLILIMVTNPATNL